MTKEIIYTENYALIVDDSEIKEGDYCIHRDTEEMYKSVYVPLKSIRKDCKKIIFHLPLNGSKELEGVPLLPEIKYQFTEDDIKIAIQQAFLSGIERLTDFEIVENMIIQNVKRSKRPTHFCFEIGNLSTEETKSDLVFGTYFKTQLINGKPTAVGTYKY